MQTVVIQTYPPRPSQHVALRRFIPHLLEAKEQLIEKIKSFDINRIYMTRTLMQHLTYVDAIENTPNWDDSLWADSQRFSIKAAATSRDSIKAKDLDLFTTIQKKMTIFCDRIGPTFLGLPVHLLSPTHMNESAFVLDIGKYNEEIHYSLTDGAPEKPISELLERKNQPPIPQLISLFYCYDHVNFIDSMMRRHVRWHRILPSYPSASFAAVLTQATLKPFEVK